MPSKNDGLAKVKPKSKSVATGKFANGSSATDLKAGDIDWRVFGLDLEPAPGQGGARGPAIPPPNPGGPMPFSPAAPDGGAARAPAGRRTPPGMKLGPLDGVKSQTSTLAYPAPQPFDTTDLSHLRSKAKRTQGYTDNLPPLQVLLEERGVDYSRPNPMRDVQLPLEAFEDTMMCTRQPSEWAALMRDPMTGEVVPLACRALKLMDDGSGRWQNGMVTVWDAESQRYIVRWSTGQEDKVLSLHVLFNGDDPILFADRLATALQNRRYANSLLKYHFFVDSMPEDKTRRIGRETATKIASKAKANMWNASSDFAEKLDKRLDQLVEEAQKEYLRVQNAITFEKVHNNGSLNSLPVDLQLPPEEEKPTVPYLAVKVLPRYEVWMGPPDPLLPRGFGQAFEWFCQASLLIRPEVCAALQVTRGMCLDLLTERVFETAFLSPMRNSEFQERQEGSIMRMKGRLGMWVNTIRMRVTQSLQQAQEKWFQLNETSLENYRASRLRLLLVTCRLMMSNAFLVLADANLNQFTSAVSDLVPLRVEIPEAGTKHPLKHIQHFVADPKAASGESIVEPLFKQTIFRMEVKIEEPEPPAPPVDDKKKGKDAAPPPPPKKAFAFLTQPEDFKQSMLNAFDQGITAFQDVHSVESVLLPHLIRDDHLDPNFRPSDKWVVDLRQQVADACDKHLPWLDQVLVLLDSYKDVVQLDPQASVDKMKAGDPTPANEVKRLIEDRQKRAKEIMEGIPDEKEPLPIGFYKLDTSSFRSPMVEKLELSVELMLKMLADQLDVDVRSATESFGDMFNQLKTEVSDIEGVSDMREYLKSIPGELSKLQGAINDAMSTTALIEDMRYMLPADTLDARWRMFGSPGDVKREMSKVEEYLDGKHKEYLSKQESEQVDFEKRLSELEAVIESFAAYQSLDQVTEVAAKVKSTTEEIKQCQDMVRLFNSREALFDRDSTDYSNLGSMVKVFEPFSNLWKTAGDWVENKESWLKGSFESIDPRYAEGEVVNGIRLLFKTIRTLKENEDTKAIVGIAEQIKVELEEFKPNLPLITGLRNEGMRDRHWEQVSKACGVQVGPTMEGGLTLQNLIDKGLLEYTQEVADVGDRAGKEFGLEKTLAKMKADWEPLLFDLSEKYRKTNTYILKGDGEAMALLDEQIVTTQAMMFSMFKGPFEEEIDEWNARLMRVSETLEEWLKCQRAWMYLQPIFDSDDIMRQLPTEGKRFKHVDSSWRQQMTYTRDNPKIIDVCAQEGLLETWRECNITLDMVQKGLEDYLETKRNGFARFYFLSNDELLEILSQTKDPTRVQPFLSKVFEAMSKVTFTSDNDITDMFSPEGEKITFGVPVVTYQKQVEVWMGDLENASCQAIRAAIHKGVETYQGMVRTEWVLANPGQIVLNSSQAHWTAEVEAAFHAGEIIQYGEKLAQQILDIVKLFDPKVNPAGLTKMQRTTIGALVVIDVHAKDIIQEFGRNGVVSAASFEWISQLRYYWQMDDRGTENLWVNCVQTSFPYGYEYLGNSMRLVITPLTDMCYITLMGAQALNLGGAPAGPAGTGKTETTKDLGKALAVPVVVFNCSDGLDYKIMGRFFSGLAQAGAWACFDEFNRIQVEVLSVIAQQMLTVTQAIRQRKDIFEFLGRDIPLNMRFGVYITMNPGYAGRSELPDNLKALFRPCAMMVPDYALIGEIVLYSFGFEDAKNLARKAVGSLRLSSEQLSSQDHYDFGMRALKSILVRAGGLRRIYGSGREESVLALSALNDVNLPKFTSNDIPLFLGITGDLFPGVKLPPSDYGALINELEGSAAQQGLQPVKGFIRKCIQLWETIIVRHGLMLVGETMSGKTEVENVLASALAKVADGELYLPVKMHKINPKSIKQGQLYGDFDEATHEWSDGILALAVRYAATADASKRQWVLLDGPVDAVWIENMNTVLDDNKKLCLNSGEIIKLSSVTTMMFEVEDLAVASPATVSRCGMIFIEQVDMGWRVLVDSWCQKLHERLQDHVPTIRDLFESVVDRLAEVILRRCAKPVAVNMHWLVMNLLNLYQSFIAKEIPLEEDTKDLPAKEKESKLDALFWLSVIWSFGCSTNQEGQNYLNEFFRKLAAGHPLKEDYELLCSEPTVIPSWKTPIPEADTIFDYYVDSTSGKWEPWTKKISGFDIPKDAQVHSINVPTKDTVRNAFLLQTLVSSKNHVLFCGETGTGKTVTIQQEILKKFDREHYTDISFSFSAQTTANQTQDIIDGKLDKRKKGTYGPPLGKRCLVFVDDLNMPAKEKYGAQPPIELLRQWMDTGGWYERKTSEFRELVDLNFIGAMGPPGAGKPTVTPRYQRHFSYIFVVPFHSSSLERIFLTIMNWFLAKFPGAVSGLAKNVVLSTIEVYETISRDMLPTPAKSHYTFNLRDLSKVNQGLCLCTKNSLANDLDLMKCWAHECQRVFQDRLVNDEDRAWFANLLHTMMETHFKKKWGQVVKREPIIYSDFIDSKAPYYQEVQDMEQLSSVLNNMLADYNQEAKRGMELVLFMAAMEHVCRVVRVLKTPLGNALLVGVGGSGRKSMATLATFVAEYEQFSIEITSKYSVADWHDDIKRLLMRVGGMAKEVTFLLSDTQIPKESFLEDTSSLLNNGEVPNLFNMEDKTQILEICGQAANQAGKHGQQEIFAYFVGQCRKNLHLVLALSPIGEAFRRRVRMFPAIVNCCTIDWFMEWPDAALRGVADHFLHQVDLQESVFRGVVEICVEMQKSVFTLVSRFHAEMQRYYYVTPTSYLELINAFKDVLESKRTEVTTMKGRYDEGLDKLMSTEEQVQTMSLELEELKPVLKKTSEETAELMVVIEKKQEEAAQTAAIVGKEEATCSQQAEEARVMKEDCQADLDQAIPALNAALDALKTLKKGDIVEVKNMKTPPDGVINVSKALCLCFDVKPKKVTAPDGRTKIDDYWEPSKKSLWGDPKLLDRLLGFDKDHIPEEIMSKLKPLEDDPNFDPQVIHKASVAAFGICKWVRAMIVYDGVAKVVAPKKAQLEQAETELNAVLSALAQKKAELKEVEDNVARLVAEFETAKAKKEKLLNDVDDCSKRLVRAEKLISGLGGEKTRWNEASGKLGGQYDNLTGDVLISSGIIAYLGAFMGRYREDTVQSWIDLMHKNEVPSSREYTLRAVVGEDVVIRQWVIDKLPNDKVSIENALILARSRRWPLMIDPQMQANQWIRKSYGDSLIIVRLTQAMYAKILETAITQGKPVLMENVGEVMDPLLDPLLQKATFKTGAMSMIRLGDSTIEWSADFRLFITTKLPNPHYSPEICVQVTLLNFMATPEGLKDQMLGILVAKEEQETERKRQNLIVESAQSKAQLKEIEDRILELLSNATGNILDDEELINTLANSKVASQRIEERVVEQEKTQALVQETRETYVPVAIRASALFFVVADLCAVEPMYQYSLEWFIKIYELAIVTAERPERNMARRLQALQDQFVRLIYQKTCDSLFERDKLMFSLLLSFKSMEVDGDINQAEKSLLLLACGGVPSVDVKKPDAPWLTDVSWNRICVLDGLKKGPWTNFAKSFKDHILQWQHVFDSDSPAEQSWPSGLKEHMTPLQKALVLLAVRTDCTVGALQEVIAAKLGREFLEPPSFNLEKSFQDSSSCVPLIFVLSPGADPMGEIVRLGQKMQMNDRMNPVSLGQGQGPKAERAIADGRENGIWVVLQNCHLAPSWMGKLETLCEELNPDKVNEAFRLWLTAMPSPNFPVSVLQNGLKMTNEPPKGVKSNLLRAYLSFESSWFHEACGTAEPKQHAFRKMLFGLCFFHALIQERCGFGPLGWNIPYQFSEPDREICVSQLNMFIEENDAIPYAALRYTAAEANYGGRVTDANDRRTINFILTDFYCPEILNDGYKFSPSGVYYAPKFQPLNSYVDYIRSLPLNQMPEVFGLHANANLSASISEAMRLLQTACSLQPKTAGGADAKSPDAIMAETSADFLEKLPKPFDTEACQVKYPVDYNESMNTVLNQELLRFNRLLVKVRRMLADVGRAVKGLVVMDADLEVLASGILTNTVPPSWKSVSYPSLKPLSSYVADLCARLKFFQDWIKKGIPPTYWLSGFFFTQSFLTGQLQNFARKEHLPIDMLIWNYKVQLAGKITFGDFGAGCMVYGLFIEGARWDDIEGVVAESLPKVLFSEMPHFHLIPCEVSKDATVRKTTYPAPIYKTSERKGTLSTSGHNTNYVMTAMLPMAVSHTEKHWTKRGVALLTQLDD
eukprot:TRINITY_DN20312_c0_g2_i4.p1 TRINITY_DN20312_c0_g2~~TRINITY_DN20312_c0_g2_i4.p1  ORF type:complete len:4213 (-),score=1296.02 TRINITY_DN20312_c0_g2_i4:279-12917(-)